MKKMRIGTFLCIVLLLFTLHPLATVQGLPYRSPVANVETKGEKDGLIPLSLRVKIDPQLLKELDQAGPVDKPALATAHPRQAPFIVYLRQQANLSKAASMPDKVQRRQAVVAALREIAELTQREILGVLQAERAAGHVSAFRAYWVFNGLAVTGDLHALLAIASRPEVEFVRYDRPRYLPPRPEAEPVGGDEGKSPWNISKVKADLVWGSFGVTGEGIVVANMDTGVDYQHPALLSKYRGYQGDRTEHNYNWFDPTGTYPSAPGDGNGHGTHTMGTIVGSEPDGSHAIGVAPGARWVAVKIFTDKGQSSDSIIFQGFQWILAPTDILGANPDPSKAPDIVSNSWGSDDGSDITFQPAVRAWRAAGIFSAFAAGNEGPEPRTVGSPASFRESFAVGATDIANEVADFSSRGPSPWGEIKPEVVAPGVDIYSSVPGGRYERGWNGTSMSTPHVAGLAALLWHADRKYNRLAGQGANPTLTITRTEEIILQTALELGDPGPDNSYGWGLIDAYQAVRTVIPHGTFWGRVTDQQSGGPIDGALITMISLEHGGMAKTVADAQGFYTFSVASGLYDVVASHFYYAPKTVHRIEVLRGTTTQLDFALQARPAGFIQGRVTDKMTGRPLSAVVEALGTEIRAHTDRAGEYQLKLPVGVYTIRALADAPGYRGAKAEGILITLGTMVEQDFALATAPKILIVNAEVWRQERVSSYYEDALKVVLYSYNVRDISNPPRDNPTAADLQAYDVVVWSHPKVSPGYIDAWGALAMYLDNGGRLFIAGQDIGYWDVERGEGASYYRNYLHSNYIRDETGIEQLAGTAHSILEGLAITLNTEDSAQNQRWPSEIAPADSMAIPVASYIGDGYGGLQIDDCNLRAVYLAFGLEGVGPQTVREEIMARVLAWLGAERPAYGVNLVPARQGKMGFMGSYLLYDAEVINAGQNTDSIALSARGNRWPVAILARGTSQPMSVVTLAACGAQGITVRVSVPVTAAIGDTDLVTVTATSLTQPSVSAEAVLQTAAFPSWQEETPLPVPRSRAGATGVGNNIYIIGGESSGGSLNLVHIYNPAARQWRLGKPKPTAVSNISIAAIGNKIYVPGGYNETSLATFEVYDTTSDTWSRAANLPQPRSAHVTVAVGGKLYVIGGVGGEGFVDTTWEYDPVTNNWASRANMPHARGYAAGGVVNGKVYIVGGANDSADDLPYVEEYDPVADYWTVKKNLAIPRMGPAAVGLEGFLYMVGGGYNSYLPNAERYDPATDTWQSLSFMQHGRRTLGLAAACGSLYAISGWNGSYTAFNESLSVGSSLMYSILHVSDESVPPGSILTYTLSLINAGQEELPASSFYNRIPQQTTYVAGSVTGGATYDDAANAITWSGTMPPRASKGFTFQVQVDSDVTSGHSITDTAIIGDGVCGPYTVTVTTLIAVPNLSASRKIVHPMVATSGDLLSYAITLTNNSLVRASGVHLVDAIPLHLTYVTDTLTGGAAYDPGFNRIEWQGAVPAGHPAVKAYDWADSDGGGITFNWIDATGGTALPGGDDESLGPFPLGFAFKFFGKPYTQLFVNTNGQVLFGSGSGEFDNTGIPGAESPNNFIAAFWDDLVCDSSALYYQTFGVAPNRYTVIEWHEVQRYGGSQPYTFEIVLYEGSNNILLQYHTMRGDQGNGSSATVGIENETGTDGIQYLYNGAPLSNQTHDRLAIIFTPQAPLTSGMHAIRFQASLNGDVPVNTVLVNTALVTDTLRQTHVLSATATANMIDLSPSSKTVDKGWAVAGDTLRYGITLHNRGNIATDALLTDTLPSGVTYVPGSLIGPGGQVYDPQTRRITWRGRVPAGQALQFAFAARISPDWSSSQPITNTIVIADLVVGRRITRSASTRVRVADLSISSKRVDKEAAVSGDTLTYSIAMVNTAPVPAGNVSLWDPIPAHTTYVPGSATGGAIYDPQRRGISWTGMISAATGVSPTIQPTEHVIGFRAIVGSNLPGNTLIVNRATIRQSATISYTRIVTTTANLVDLNLSTKEVQPLVAGSGDVLTYTITLINWGNYPAGNTSLTDPIPRWATYVANSATGGATYNAALNRIEWHGNVPGMQPPAPARVIDSDGGQVTFNWIDATSGTTIPGGDDVSHGPFPIGFAFQFFRRTYTQFYVNTNGQLLFGEGSNAFSNVAIPSPSTPNNFVAAFWDDLVCPSPRSLYYKTFGTAPNRYLVVEWLDIHHYRSQDLLTFQVILYENSNDIAVQYLTMAGSYGDGASATVGIENVDGTQGLQYLYEGAPAHNTIHSRLAVLFQQSREALPGKHTVSFRVRVKPDAPINEELVNVATISDGLARTYQRSARLNVNTIDLSASGKAVSKALADAGETLTYTITLHNRGTGSARNASLSDPLPSGTTFVPGSAGGGATYDAGRNRIVWTGEIRRGQSLPISFAVRTDPSVPNLTVITNTAWITDGVSSPFARNVRTILRAPDISASEKLVNAESAAPGEAVTYTIRVRETSDMAVSVRLTDTVPANLEYIAGSLWASSGHASYESGVIAWQGSVIAKGMVVVRFAARVARTARAGTQITNHALIRAGAAGSIQRSVSLIVSQPIYHAYLPMIMKQGAR